ncbi:MAG: hypothetical protein FWE30_07375, partial [Bacteroidales bacterium]|nr:hypothetical protein [Bacteroidales bacterium]
MEQEEEFLQSGFFIQSTHNTIAFQVAMGLGCHGYNNTFVQRRLSFESALLDACMLFEEGKVHTVSTGGHDELSPTYFGLLDKAGHYSFCEESSTGSFSGEGSISFVLNNSPQDGSYAVIQALEMQYIPQNEASFASVALPFLQRQGLAPQALGAIFTAYTEDEQS